MDKKYTPEEIKAFAEWLELEALRVVKAQNQEAQRTPATIGSMVASSPDPFASPYNLLEAAGTLRRFALTRSL
jgi:hypothetical protein